LMTDDRTPEQHLAAVAAAALDGLADLRHLLDHQAPDLPAQLDLLANRAVQNNHDGGQQLRAVAGALRLIATGTAADIVCRVGDHGPGSRRPYSPASVAYSASNGQA
jgi:hypothetical protein